MQLPICWPKQAGASLLLGHLFRRNMLPRRASPPPALVAHIDEAILKTRPSDSQELILSEGWEKQKAGGRLPFLPPLNVYFKVLSRCGKA